MLYVFIAVVVVGLIFLIVYNARGSKPKAASHAEDEELARTETGPGSSPAAEPEPGEPVGPSEADMLRPDERRDEPEPEASRYPPRRATVPASVKLIRDNDFRSSLRKLSNRESDDLHEKMESDDAYREALRAMNRKPSDRKGE